MSQPVDLRQDYEAADLRRLAKRSRDTRQARHLLALAGIYDGMSRSRAAEIGGMDRQTLRDWAHRFNAEGPDGLRDRHRSGRQRGLSAEQLREFAQIVEAGPDPDTDGVVRWRRADLKRIVEERFGVVYSAGRERLAISPPDLALEPRFWELRGHPRRRRCGLEPAHQ